MRFSHYLLPTMKQAPAEAQIVSHQLMLRAGLIRQAASGIYNWLPLGLRVLNRVQTIVREEQNRAGAIEILMPTIQPADLWRESGRYADYGKEMLRILDRHDRELLYGPTNEEMVTDIIRQTLRSYRSLPINLYHIQWKFRDEVRPRFGVMRGREFLMKDGYSFDLDYKQAHLAYAKMFVAYLRTYARMGLRAIPMLADSGPIGGDLSHEFIIIAKTGESLVYCDPWWLEAERLIEDEDPQTVVARFSKNYAATEDKHDPAMCPVPADQLVSTRGIEVGHIFYFGTKYSSPMGAVVTNNAGEQVALHMGSYGIGVSRLVGALIEAHHDEKGIIWPSSVAPFDVALLNLKTGNKLCDEATETLYCNLRNAGIEVLYDERDERAGIKLADADLIGLPWQIVIGPNGIASNIGEIKNRQTGTKIDLAISDIIGFIKQAS